MSDLSLWGGLPQQGEGAGENTKTIMLPNNVHGRNKIAAYE
jgi:hypothetical protein